MVSRTRVRAIKSSKKFAFVIVNDGGIGEDFFQLWVRFDHRRPLVQLVLDFPFFPSFDGHIGEGRSIAACNRLQAQTVVLLNSPMFSRINAVSSSGLI